MDSLPDPMRPEWAEILFVIVLLTATFFFLKHVLFQPLTKLMDEREAAIQAGGAAKSGAAAQVEQRQADYAARLKELRAQAYERRRALANAANTEKQRLLDSARESAVAQRQAALADLKVKQESAKAELLAQVDSLSESMVQHLLKQA